MITASSHIFIAVPAMEESEHFPAFMACVQKQTVKNFSLFICVNQPDEWWTTPDKKKVCIDNQRSLTWLRSLQDQSLVVIDRSSPGSGWMGKKTGVGWARRTIMDAINAKAGKDDLIVSLDVDTTFNPTYLESLIRSFSRNKHAVGLSVPYYHRLTGDEIKDRAILRYEVFMRYFGLNLWRIRSPYSFTAIGSAIALPVSAYRSIGGITPHKSGEDFYLLQKLRKLGQLLTWNEEKVYPAARYSDRVGFGTGPAMIRGRENDWSSYPIYPAAFFDEVEETFRAFPLLFEFDTSTPMDAFIRTKFRDENIWKPLRANASTQKQFIRACHHKLDAFRTMQYLKWRMTQNTMTDEAAFTSWLQRYYPDRLEELVHDIDSFSFAEISIAGLDRIRDFLVDCEAAYQTNNFLPEI